LLPRPLVGAVRCGGVALLAPLLTSCGGGPVDVDPPTPDVDVVEQCHALLDGLPETVDGQDRRDISPGDALAAAWGDPAIVLRCGVTKPAALTPTSFCLAVDDVGWLPVVDGREYDMARPPDDTIVFTTIGRSAYIEVTVPERWSGDVDALADVADAVKASTQDIQPCL
jgi:hypothetical protein